jgi:glycosyltransferase involved in cell wall biosynthesis
LDKWPYDFIKPKSISLITFHLATLFHFIFKPEKFDIIHIHGDWSSLLFVSLLKKITGSKKIVFSFHGNITNNFAHQKLLPRLLKQVDKIFITGYNAGHALAALTRRKVIIQPSGINKLFFEDHDKDFNYKRFQVITVANLHPVKNIPFILSMADQMRDVDFLIVGDGGQRDFLQNSIKKDNLENVFLLGFKEPEKVKELYNNSDCFLLTSFEEGTPTSALEAMACGLPVVSSTAGGLNNIIKEYDNGFIIESFEIDKFINKLQLLKSDIELRKKIFFNNKLLSKNYGWEIVAKKITDNTIDA